MFCPACHGNGRQLYDTVCSTCSTKNSEPMLHQEDTKLPTGQNRPYPPGCFMVRAKLLSKDKDEVIDQWDFNWNDRDSVRRFAADSDRHVRAGGSTLLGPAPE